MRRASMIVVTTSRGAIGQRVFETVLAVVSLSVCPVPGPEELCFMDMVHVISEVAGNAVGVQQSTGEAREAGRTGCGCPTPWQGSLLTW